MQKDFRSSGRFKLAQNGQLQLRITVQAPDTKQPLHLKGGLVLKINDFEPFVLPIEISCEFPRISCAKELFSV